MTNMTNRPDHAGESDSISPASIVGVTLIASGALVTLAASFHMLRPSKSRWPRTSQEPRAHQRRGGLSPGLDRGGVITSHPYRDNN
jgi:hypothetical protein